MWRAKFLHLLPLTVALFASVSAQQTATPVAQSGNGAASASEANVAPGNLFQRPGETATKTSSDSDGTLLLQADRNRTSVLGQYAFTAAPGFYSDGRSTFERSDWNSDVTGAVTAYFSSSYTSALRLSADFLSYGEKRQPGGTGDPGGQSFTAEGEFVRVVSSKLGALEIGGGSYWQRLVSNRAFLNGPITQALQQYTGSESGFETTLTLPDRNLVFLFRYGKEDVGVPNLRSHATTFQLSWTW
jgi:hypothetical protein